MDNINKKDNIDFNELYNNFRNYVIEKNETESNLYDKCNKMQTILNNMLTNNNIDYNVKYCIEEFNKFLQSELKNLNIVNNGNINLNKSVISDLKENINESGYNLFIKKMDKWKSEFDKKINNLQSNFSDEIKEIYIDVDKDIIADLSDELKINNFFLSDTETLRNKLKINNRKNICNDLFNNSIADKDYFNNGNSFDLLSLQAYDNYIVKKNIIPLAILSNTDYSSLLSKQFNKLKSNNSNISIPMIVSTNGNNCLNHYTLLNMRNIKDEIYISIIDSLDNITDITNKQTSLDGNVNHNNYMNRVLNTLKNVFISHFPNDTYKIHYSFIKGDTIEVQHANSGIEDFRNVCPILTIRNYLLMDNLNNDKWLTLYNRTFEKQKSLIKEKIKLLNDTKQNKDIKDINNDIGNIQRTLEDEEQKNKEFLTEINNIINTDNIEQFFDTYIEKSLTSEKKYIQDAVNIIQSYNKGIQDQKRSYNIFYENLLNKDIIRRKYNIFSETGHTSIIKALDTVLEQFSSTNKTYKNIQDRNNLQRYEERVMELKNKLVEYICNKYKSQHAEKYNQLLQEKDNLINQLTSLEKTNITLIDNNKKYLEDNNCENVNNKIENNIINNKEKDIINIELLYLDSLYKKLEQQNNKLGNNIEHDNYKEVTQNTLSISTIKSINSNNKEVIKNKSTILNNSTHQLHSNNHNIDESNSMHQLHNNKSNIKKEFNDDDCDYSEDIMDEKKDINKNNDDTVAQKLKKYDNLLVNGCKSCCFIRTKNELNLDSPSQHINTLNSCRY